MLPSPAEIAAHAPASGSCYLFWKVTTSLQIPCARSLSAIEDHRCGGHYTDTFCTFVRYLRVDNRILGQPHQHWSDPAFSTKITYSERDWKLDQEATQCCSTLAIQREWTALLQPLLSVDVSSAAMCRVLALWTSRPTRRMPLPSVHDCQIWWSLEVSPGDILHPVVGGSILSIQSHTQK